MPDAETYPNQQQFTEQAEGMILQLADGSIQACNASAEKILGLTTPQLIGRNLFDLPWQLISEDALHPAMVALTTGKPCLQVDCGFYQPNTLQIRLLINSQPLFQAQESAPYAVVTTFREIVAKHNQTSQNVAILGDSQHLIQQIAHIIPGLLYIYDLEQQRNFYVNHEIDQLWGYNPEQIQTMGRDLFQKIMHPEDLSLLPAHFAKFKSASNGEVLIFEYRILHANGEWRWFCSYETVFRRLVDESPQQILGIAFDITERRCTEVALQQSNERFRLAAAAVNDLIYDWDVQKNTVERTLGLTEIFGYTPEEAKPTLQWWQEIIHPDDLEMFNHKLTSSLSTGNRFSIEYRIRHKNGHYRWVDDRGFAVRDADNEIVRVVGATQDITQRKQAEIDVLQREIQLRRLFDSNIIGIIFANTEQIIEANDAFLEIVGYTREELLAGKLRRKNITPPEYHDLDQQGLEDLLRVGICTPFEKEYIRKDNSRIPVLIGGALVHREPLSWVCFILDLSQRKQLEQALRQKAEELQQANKIKDEFLAILSHELRSPLNPILGWSTLLKSHKLDAATTTRALDTIERNTKLQMKLIDDLLDVSRIIQGKLSLHFATVNLGYVIDGALETVRLAAAEKSIQIHKQMNLTDGLVWGDFHRLQQVLGNLLGNAIKFSSSGHQIEVALSVIPPDNQHQGTANYAQITVKDTGKGITAEFLPHIFEYFQQADITTTRKFGGLGLGLAIVRHLVELHGGTVAADSPGEGQGATFTVKLPLMIESHKAENKKLKQEEKKLNSSLLGGLKILIVDDKADTRQFISFLLQQYGAIASMAATANEALKMISQSPPDLLISDLGMPEVDGYKLIRLIRNMSPEKGGNIPAIALTSYAGERDKQQVLAAGFQKHVAKPVAPNELLTLIAELMQQRRNWNI
ncbi:MAG: PAS domain-containing protein [Nostoc sp. LLA-1]|nr:PAS domain-containing protein [Cyanocohniella sp. LLY]